MIVVSSSSVVSDVTSAPPPQELPHCDEDAGGGRIAMPPPPCATAAPALSLAPQRGSSFSSTPHYSGHAEPRRSATWPMINAAGCGAKYCLIRGHHRPCPGVCLPASPGTWQPTVRWGCQGGGAGQRSWGRGQGCRFAAWPPPPSCLAGDTSVTAGQTPGVTDQDLRRSEAWLGKCRRLASMIKAVIAGPPSKAHCHGRGRGEHLARPWRGAGGWVVMVGWMMGCEEIPALVKKPGAFLSMQKTQLIPCARWFLRE